VGRWRYLSPEQRGEDVAISSREPTIPSSAFFITAACIHLDIQREATSPYPPASAVASDYDQHVGQETLLFGTVTTADEETLAIRTATSNGPLELTVPNTTASVETGGTVQVYGTL
jgi:hypothetical protein